MALSTSPLPLDVVDDIAHFLALSDLLSFARTSSQFHPLAQRLIYRHVSIHDSRRALRCLQTLSAEIAPALFVRSFSLRLDPDQPLFPPFVCMLATALSRMSNITSLDFLLHHSAARALAAPDTVTYPRLTHFACNFPADDALSAFLLRVPSLAELQLGDAVPSSPMRSLPATAIPSLALFVGSCEAAAVLAPGRPLECVHLHSGDLSEDVLSALSRSTAPITVFGALISSLSPPLLSSLATHLPYLRHLRIMTVYHSSRQRDEMFYANATRILGSLPELMTAELAGIHWSPWKKRTADFNSDLTANGRGNATAALEDPLDFGDGVSTY